MNKKNKKVAIIGLGYVGLPLAVLAQEKGWQTIGVDIDADKVATINKKEVPFKDEELLESLKKYPIEASTSFAKVSDVDIVIVAVPTPVKENNQPDLTPLVSAITEAKPYMQEGQTVVVESTVNPGVMDEIITPILKDGPSVNLVHCPERINPGDPKWSVRNIPRVLGGYTEQGAKEALEFYESVIEAPIKVMQSPTEAEAVKIMENTFRDINIAFINEMARSFAVLGIDITNVIEGAATKPFAFMPHYPGNGVGGHCISVDPYYMIERAKQVGFDHQFLKLARRINEDMPAYTIELLLKAAEKTGVELKNMKVALLGLAYKKDVSDIRNSPALKTLELLNEKKIESKVFDPFVSEGSTVSSLEDALQEVDAVILACDHTDMVSNLSAEKLVSSGVKIVIDGKNALDVDSISETDIIYFGIGRSTVKNKV
jgi:UDP-N-acetyl-D-glucosamine dehydrogenase